MNKILKLADLSSHRPTYVCVTLTCGFVLTIFISIPFVRCLFYILLPSFIKNYEQIEHDVVTEKISYVNYVDKFVALFIIAIIVEFTCAHKKEKQKEK
jgi:hypothetical protein